VLPVVLPVVLPATALIAALVMPLIGPLPAPFAAVRIEAADAQAEGGHTEGQDEKRSFHVHSRVDRLEGLSRHVMAGTIGMGETHEQGRIVWVWRREDPDASGSPVHRGPKRVAGAVAGFDPIVKLLPINTLYSSNRWLLTAVHHNGAGPSSF
jgi:hypothetical protein